MLRQSTSSSSSSSSSSNSLDSSAMRLQEFKQPLLEVIIHETKHHNDKKDTPTTKVKAQSQSEYIKSLKEQKKEIEIAISILKSAIRKRQAICGGSISLIWITSILTMIMSALRIYHTVTDRHNAMAAINDYGVKYNFGTNLTMPCEILLNDYLLSCSKFSNDGYYDDQSYTTCSSLIDNYCNVDTIFGTQISRYGDIATSVIFGLILPLYLMANSACAGIKNHCRSHTTMSEASLQKLMDIIEKYQIDDIDLNSYPGALQVLEEHLIRLNIEIQSANQLFENAHEQRNAFLVSDAKCTFFDRNVLADGNILNMLFDMTGCSEQTVEGELVKPIRIQFEKGSRLNKRNPDPTNPLFCFFDRLTNEPKNGKKEQKNSDDKSVENRIYRAYEKEKVLRNIYEFAGL